MIRLVAVRGNCCRHFSSAASSSLADFNKNEENGIAHVTSINVQSGDRSIVRLSQKEGKRSRRFRREYVLPEAAVSGLRQAIIDCQVTPKQLQNMADQMSERLAQRRFPAPPEVVKKVRDEIKRKLLKEGEQNGDILDDDMLVDKKINEAREYQLRSKVDKLLKKSRYNWKPLEFETRESAAAYALSRIAPNYAEISRSLEELTDFSPESVLDFGSGCGAGYWAVNDRFDSIKEICMVDTCDNMTKMAMDIMRGANGELIPKNVSFRRHLIPSLQTTYDLVIAHRILGEIGSYETRMQLIESLWARTNRFLVLVDSGMQDSFEAILDVRDYLLTAGTTLHKEETIRVLKENNYLSEPVLRILKQHGYSDIERFSLLREMLPVDIALPTVLPTATVFAPCPHDLGCPLRSKSSCSFDVRWRTIRADGKKAQREKDGTETGRFSYVILEKGSRQPLDEVARLLKIRKMNGHVTCDVCTAYRGIQRVTISKRTGQLYQTVRAKRDGEQFPLEMRTRATEGMFDLYELAAQDEK